MNGPCPAAVEACYEDAERDVKRIAAKFARGKRDCDAFSEASLAFCLACRDYRRGRGPFLRWVRYACRKHLLQKARAVSRERARVRVVALEELPARREVDVVKLVGEAGPDAAAVLEVLIGLGDSPPRKAKALLRGRLGRMGWTRGRISKAFEDVREAIA